MDLAPNVACPLCELPSRRLFAKSAVWIRECTAPRCAHRFAEFTPTAEHVTEVYGDSYFSGGGAGYADYLSEDRLLRARGRWYARRLRNVAKRGEVLDVGAAAGFFLAGFRDAGWRAFGVEPNPRMASHARERLGLDVTASSWEMYATDRTFDLISIVQVLPHLADPQTALAKAAALVKPGGGVLVETWNVASLTARLFGSAWHEYSPPSVLHWFAPHRLRQMAARVGLRERAVGRPSKWLDAGHAKSLLEYKLGDGWMGTVCRLGGKLIPDGLPIPYPAEDLFWGLYVKPR